MFPAVALLLSCATRLTWCVLAGEICLSHALAGLVAYVAPRPASVTGSANRGQNGRGRVHDDIDTKALQECRSVWRKLRGEADFERLPTGAVVLEQSSERRFEALRRVRLLTSHAERTSSQRNPILPPTLPMGTACSNDDGESPSRKRTANERVRTGRHKPSPPQGRG